MKYIQSPHEKLSEKEVKDAIQMLLSNHEEIWRRFDDYYRDQKIIYTKLKRHFFLEKDSLTYPGELFLQGYPNFAGPPLRMEIPESM